MNLGMEITNDANRLQESNGEGRIINNGMCDIIITNMYVNKSKDGNNKGLALNMEFKKAEDMNKEDAVKQTIFQAIIYRKADGTVNTYGQDLLSKIAKVCGKTQDELNKTVSKQITIGKDKKVETVEAIPALTGAKLTGKFRQEFDMYDGKLTDRVRLLTVFRTTDKASAQEILKAAEGADVVLGKQYAMENEKEVTPRYANGLNAEKVEQLKKEQSNNSNNTSKATEADSNFLADSGDNVSL